MLTPGDSWVDVFLSIRPHRLENTFSPPPWWEDYPAIQQKIEEVDEAFRATIAVFGTDEAAELPEPMLLLNHLPDGPQFADLRGLAAKAFRRSVEQLTETTDIWSLAEVEILRALKSLDQVRKQLLR